MTIKQTLIASSIIQAEFVTCYQATIQAFAWKTLFQGFRLSNQLLSKLKIFHSNFSVVFYSKDNKRSSSTKHIEIKYLGDRDKVKDGLIIVEHIGSKAVKADLLTKVFVLLTTDPKDLSL